MDIVRKEIQKLLDADVIYPISDIPWVSPIHVVPKKTGIIVEEDWDHTRRRRRRKDGDDTG
ncbi:unnamed protein product [Rhodiola kirilowii]